MIFQHGVFAIYISPPYIYVLGAIVRSTFSQISRIYRTLTDMTKLILFSSILFIASFSFGQKPKNGTYTYAVAFAEWNGKSNGATCTVKIKGDSVTVIHNGGNLTGTKGEIIDKGILMKHTKTGKWIIAHSKEDKDAKEVGGCSDGPAVIDFKRKKFWMC